MQHSRRWVTKRPGQLIAVSLVTLGIVAAACGGDNSGSTPTTTGGGTATTGGGGATTTAGGTATTTATTAATTTTTAAAKPTPGGTITVRIEAEVGNPWTPSAIQCDSACQIRARTFYEALMAIDATTLKPKPYLAQSVEHSADYKAWTVKVRPNINFSDGTPLNADAVIDNTNRARRSFLAGASLKNIADVKKIDDMTVEMDMTEPWTDFDYYLTSTGFFQASPTWLAAVDADPSKATQPIGTGPFVLDSFKAGESTIVKKNPGYWRKDEGLPYLDEIDFRIVQDELSAANAMKAGEFTFMPTDNAQNLKTFRDDKNFGYSEQKQYGETNYILLNVGQDGSPLEDQRVRCGLAAATDTKTLNEAINANQLTVANGLFSPGQQGYLDDPGNQKYDPAKAKQLISAWSAEHGGQKPHIIYSTVNDATSLQTAQLLQQWWQDAGADVEVVQIEQSKLITNALLSDPQFMAFGWRNHAGVIFETQYVWWHSSTALPPGQLALNFGRLKDAQMDQLLTDARTNPDPAAGKKDGEEANRLFAKECWVIPTAWTIWGMVAKPELQGLGTTTFPQGEPGTLLDGVTPFPGQVFFTNAWLKK